MHKIIVINYETIQKLKKKASISPCYKSRVCLHESLNDSLQDMLICLNRKSYVRPHKHRNKEESLQIIEGRFLLVLFDDRGAVIGKKIFGPCIKKNSILCRIREGVWHTVIPISSFVVIHEVTTGMENGLMDRVYAPWSPENGGIEATKFTRAILKAGR